MSLTMHLFKRKVPDYIKELVELGLSEAQAKKFLDKMAVDMGISSLVDVFLQDQQYVDRHNIEELQRPPSQRRFWRRLFD